MLYGFAVKAINAIGVSDLSEIAILMSAEPALPPAKPKLVSQDET